LTVEQFRYYKFLVSLFNITFDGYRGLGLYPFFLKAGQRRDRG